jgi:hypothetical protein
VCTLGDADLGVDKANLVGGPTIDALALGEDLLTHDLAEQLVPSTLGLAGQAGCLVFVLALSELGDDGIAGSLECSLALELALRAHGDPAGVRAMLGHKGDHIGIQLGRGSNCSLLDTGELTELVHGADDLLDLAVSEVHSVHHLGL